MFAERRGGCRGLDGRVKTRAAPFATPFARTARRGPWCVQNSGGRIHELRHTPKARRGRDPHRERPAAQGDARLAAPDRARHRRDHRHRHLHPDRRGGRPGRAGGDPLLCRGRRGLRLRGPQLRGNGDPDAARRQRLQLFLRDPRRTGGLGDRLEPDPRIHPGLQRGLGGLVGLRHRPDPRRPPADPGEPAGRAGSRRPGQPAGGVRRAPGHRHVARRHAGERDGQLRPGLREAGGAGGLRGVHPAALRRDPLPPLRALRLRGHRDRRQEIRRDGRGGDHLLRFLRLRRDLDRGRGGQEPQPRPDHRHRRLNAALHGHLHGGGRLRAWRLAL